MTLETVLFTIVVGFFLLRTPRDWAVLPLIVGVSYMTLGPTLEIGPFNFTVIRILIAAGFVRLWIRGESIRGPWNGLDRLMLCWGAVTVLSAIFHRDFAESLVFRLGLVYNGLGLYFLLRAFIREPADLMGISKAVMVALIPVAVAMMIEAATSRNLFAALGGVPEFSDVRGGKIRAQGPFAHSILAGTVGAVCFPLGLVLWKKNPRLAAAGMVATAGMVITSRSSGPMMTFLVVLAGMYLWKYRDHMRFLRGATVISLLALAVLMDAPVYYLLDRIDLTGSSTGWHRAFLIESAIRDVGDWWIGGTDYTRDWTPNPGYTDDETDITNHYLRMAVWGGLPMLLTFAGLLLLGFRYVRDLLGSYAGGDQPHSFVFWILGVILFGHTVTMVSVSYFDQSVFFLYLVIAAIGSMYSAAAERDPALAEVQPVLHST